MTVKELSHVLALTEFTLPQPEREVTGGYVGDLLSWVMGRAQAGNAWITIMSNHRRGGSRRGPAPAGPAAGHQPDGHGAVHL